MILRERRLKNMKCVLPDAGLLFYSEGVVFPVFIMIHQLSLPFWKTFFMC